MILGVESVWRLDTGYGLEKVSKKRAVEEQRQGTGIEPGQPIRTRLRRGRRNPLEEQLQRLSVLLSVPAWQRTAAATNEHNAWPCALARGGLRLFGRSRRGGARAGKPAPPVGGGKSRQALRPLHASTPPPNDRRPRTSSPQASTRDSAWGRRAAAAAGRRGRQNKRRA